MHRPGLLPAYGHASSPVGDPVVAAREAAAPDGAAGCSTAAPIGWFSGVPSGGQTAGQVVGQQEDGGPGNGGQAVDEERDHALAVSRFLVRDRW